MRVLRSLVLSFFLHALLLGIACTAPPAERESPAYPLHIDVASADHVVVLEEVEEAVEIIECVKAADPVIKDAKVGDHNETDNDIGLGGASPGDPRWNADAPFEGPTTNGVIGIGGGAGGFFGGRRRGGRRTLGGFIGRRLSVGGGGRLGRGNVPTEPPKRGYLEGRETDGTVLGRFPLRHTDVDAHVGGWLAETALRQTYENRFDRVVEAVYVLPLPTDAAVNEFVMEVQGRRIVGVVRPREEAQRIYAEARARGQTASLMSQERPNVFTQSVANIEPGGSVDVTVTYFHSLRYDEGAYEYVFPMVVGPRYIPGSTAKGPREPSDTPAIAGGGGRSPDTDQVPDASRISPPILPEGMRSGRGVTIRVAVDAAVEIERVGSPSHEVVVVRDDIDRATIELARKDIHPDRDFVARWHVRSDEIGPGFLAHRDERNGGFFSAFLVPQLDPGDADLTPREVTFVMDTSGSMGGVPIATSKALVTKALGSMRPYDRFNVIQFAGSSGSMAEAPVEATPENLDRGRTYIWNMRGRGGTEMLSGIRAWLAQPRDPRYLRVVVFLTDGFVGNEEAIHALIRDEGQDARWFAFGIGSSVNRYLVEGIAEQGNGAVEVVSEADAGAAVAAAERLFRRFDKPLLVDVTLDTNGLPITDVFPGRLPDLFSGEPIVVVGRYTGAAQGQLLFRGRVGGRDVAIPVDVVLPETESANRALGPVWARTRIHGIENELLGSEGEVRADLEDRIERLGLDFRLVTRRTSFVAVDEARVVGDGFPMRVLQPHEIPAGVRYWGAVGRPPSVQAARIDAWGVTLSVSERGDVMVAGVDRRGAAARAGLMRSFVIESVGGHAVHDVEHLQALLGQADATKVEVGYRNGAGDAVRTLLLDRP